MVASIRKAQGGGSLHKLAAELAQQQAYADAHRPPSIEGQAVPPDFDIETMTPLVIGRKVLSFAPGLEDESVFGFPQIQPFMHPVECPFMALVARKQTALSKTGFALAANAFVEEHPESGQAVETKGFFKVFPPPARGRFTTARLIVHNGRPRTLAKERDALHESIAPPSASKNALSATVCSFAIPPEFTGMLAERINNMPVTFTLGAMSLGLAYVPPIEALW